MSRFDWYEYLRFSNQIIATDSSQTAYRIAISRAYYSIFNLCRIYKSITSKSSDVHQIVSKQFQDSGKGKSFTIGSNLNTLRIKRNMADYDGTQQINLSDVRSAISLAESTKKLLDEVKQEEC